MCPSNLEPWGLFRFLETPSLAFSIGLGVDLGFRAV